MALNTGQGSLPRGWGIPSSLFNYHVYRTTGKMQYDTGPTPEKQYNLIWRGKKKVTRAQIQEVKEAVPFEALIDPGTKWGTGDRRYATWRDKNKNKPAYRN